ALCRPVILHSTRCELISCLLVMVFKKFLNCYGIFIVACKQRFDTVNVNWLSFLYKVMVAVGYYTPDSLDVVVKAGTFVPFSFSPSFSFVPEFWINFFLK